MASSRDEVEALLEVETLEQGVGLLDFGSPAAS